MERRLYPRVSTQLPALIANDEGVQLKVLVSDISGDGLCMECNTIERDLVTPHGRFVRDDGKPVELVVKLNLPEENGKEAEIQARCHVTFSRRIARNRCMMGVRYHDLDSNAYQRLLHFIDLVLQRNGIHQCAS
jgi:hypothetical protein